MISADKATTVASFVITGGEPQSEKL